MIDYKELNAINDAMAKIASGEKHVSVNKELAWIPSSLEESHVPAFIQAVKSAYDNGESIVEFNEQKFEVEFFVEKQELTIKPGIHGKTNVMMNEQVVRSFHETRQAKVFFAHYQEQLKNAPKKSFSNTSVKSVNVL